MGTAAADSVDDSRYGRSRTVVGTVEAVGTAGLVDTAVVAGIEDTDTVQPSLTKGNRDLSVPQTRRIRLESKPPRAPLI